MRQLYNELANVFVPAMCACLRTITHAHINVWSVDFFVRMRRYCIHVYCILNCVYYMPHPQR
jgi:hypothetical protein